MKKIGAVVILSVFVLVTIFGISRCDKGNRTNEVIMFAQIKSIEELKNLFPKTSEEIKKRTNDAIELTKKKIEEIINIPADKRTFKNTALALDRLTVDSNLEPVAAGFAVLKEVCPDKLIRESSREALQKISEFEIDFISGNIDLYKSFKFYVENQSKNEILRDDQKYFLEETMKSFKRSGLDLPKEELDKVKKIQKELVELGMAFSSNVSNDNSQIIIDCSNLSGVDKDLLDSFKKNEDGKCIVDVNMPNYFAIVETCVVEDTRKVMYRSFRNRAYPVNVDILKQVILKRDKLAKLLGFKSYSHLNLDSQMIKTPERARKFLNDLLDKLYKKENVEFENLIKYLPESVKLTDDGKFKPWDVRFIHTDYKKKYLSVDENKISEYFQLEHTLDSMFSLYEAFFGVRFEIIDVDGFWHPEVKLVKVFDEKDNKLISYLLLDLHPRPNKYGHAALFSLISGIKSDDNGFPSVGFVVANFPKSTENKPSLLKRNQVGTLFHEFGHAMHHILGRTYLDSQAGTATTTDFVEVPSQMLEDWLWDAEVLAKISKHYKTGESISKEQIEKIIALKQFDRGWFWQRQTLFSILSLDYFGEGEKKDLDKMFLSLEKKIMSNVASDEESHFYTSFGHLIGYGARYYGYIWSKVLSVDVFEHIKKQGLLRPDAGKKYVELILSKGGSEDPNNLITDFLGREPNDKAFCKNMGL